MDKHYDLGMLRIEPSPGEWIFDACKKLVMVACVCNSNAVMFFNDSAIYAKPDSNAMELARQYCLGRC